jgi:hypothetical protein
VLCAAVRHAARENFQISNKARLQQPDINHTKRWREIVHLEEKS